MTESVFDLDSVEDVECAEVRIKHPNTGEPTPMIVILAGPSHPDRKALEMSVKRRAIRQYEQHGRMLLTEPEEQEAEETDRLVAYTIGWKGANVPFSKDAARKLYTDPKKRWLRQQVITAANKAELFTRDSAQT